MKILPLTWDFRIKRFPSGLVRKNRSIFCVRGDLQHQGIDVFETYAMRYHEQLLGYYRSSRLFSSNLQLKWITLLYSIK